VRTEGVFKSLMRCRGMAKNGLGNLAVAAGALAVGALFSRKRKKEANKKKEEAEKHAAEVSAEVSLQPSPMEHEHAFVQQNTERKCPSCGYIDMTGASSCPLCFASMSDQPTGTGSEKY